MLKRKNLVTLTVAVFVLCWLSLPAHSQGPPTTTPPPDSGQVGGACCSGGQPDVKEGQPCTILHQVGPGENLHILSAYYYGDPRGWRRIYNLNRNKIRNPNVIYKGQILFIEVPPCWTPRYNFDEFMMLEQQRKEALAGPGREKTKVIEEEQTLEQKKVQIKMGEEEGAAGEGEGVEREGGAGRVRIRMPGEEGGGGEEGESRRIEPEGGAAEPTEGR